MQKHPGIPPEPKRVGNWPDASNLIYFLTYDDHRGAIQEEGSQPWFLVAIPRGGLVTANRFFSRRGPLVVCPANVSQMNGNAQACLAI